MKRPSAPSVRRRRGPGGPCRRRRASRPSERATARPPASCPRPRSSSARAGDPGCGSAERHRPDRDLGAVLERVVRVRHLRRGVDGDREPVLEREAAVARTRGRRGVRLEGRTRRTPSRRPRRGSTRPRDGGRRRPPRLPPCSPRCTKRSRDRRWRSCEKSTAGRRVAPASAISPEVFSSAPGGARGGSPR